VYVALGRILLVKGQIEEARKTFVEALTYAPGHLDAQLELARLHLGRREVDTAIGYAESALKTNPESLEAALALTRTFSVRPDDLPKAERQLRPLLAKYPNVPDVLSMAGVVALQEKEPARARQFFERAMRVDADHIEALSGLTTIDAEAGRLAEARARIEARISTTQHPHPDLMMLAVKVYAAVGDARKVEDALKRLIDADPTNLESYNLLGQFYVTQRRLPEARQQYEALAKKDPPLATVETMLGLLRQAQGDRTGAREAFKTAVRVDARAGVAANNLAWLYATEGGGSLDEALQLAQAARAQLPDSHVTADTLAYVYYKKGMGGFSLPLLEQAIQAQPRNPVYRYHLGLVHAQAGEDAKARKALQAALDLDPKFPGADDARQVMSKLIY
jgi:Tfp pilus assembly protein PilF